MPTNCRVALTTAALLVAAPALFAVDRIKEITLTQSSLVPLFEVSANQNGYFGAEPSQVEYDFGAWVLAHEGNYIKSRWLEVKRLSTGNVADLVLFEWTLKSAGGTYDKAPPLLDLVLHKTLSISASERGEVVQACTHEMKRLEAQGMPKYSILSKEHIVAGPPLFKVRFWANANPFPGPEASLGHKESSAWITLNNPVRCKKSPVVIPDSFKPPPQRPFPSGPSDLQQKFGVTAAKVWLDPNQASVVTQAKLAVHAEITANGPGTVKIRVNHNGAKGPISTLHFEKADTAPLSFPLIIKCPKDSDASSTKKTAQEQSPAAGGIGGLAAVPSNVKNGYVKIEIESPSAGKKESNDASYSVTCKKTGTLATPLPDLVILGATLPPSISKQAKVLVVVRNVGPKGAGASKIEVKGEVGGVAKSWVADVPALGTGAQTEVEIPLLARGAVGKPLHIRVDSTHKVKESNESNNTYTLK